MNYSFPSETVFAFPHPPATFHSLLSFEQWLSKYGLRKSNINITWEHVRRINSQISLQTYLIRNSGGGVQDSVLFQALQEILMHA